MSTKTWNLEATRLDIAVLLRDIGSLYLDLWTEVIYRAADKEMPGGEAMNMIGPAANLEAWEHRYEAAEARALDANDRLPEYVNDQLDAEVHPLFVLATWEDLVREEREQPTTQKATVPAAIRYLGQCDDWMLRSNPFGEPLWMPVEAFIVDLRKVQGALEGVLHAGIRSDRGTECLKCNVAMIHDWKGDHRNPKTIKDDHWHCPVCGVDSDFAQYMKALEVEYMRRATWLRADHMEAMYRIPVGTLQGWASKEHVRKKRNIHTGRMMYHVAEAVTRRDRKAALADQSDPDTEDDAA